MLIPNRTILVRFGSLSGEFGRAMVRILARRSRAKLPMARPNEPDMLPKRKKKKVRLGIYRTQIRPKTRRYFFSYLDQSGVLVIWRVKREKNSASILFSNSSSVIF